MLSLIFCLLLFIVKSQVAPIEIDLKDVDITKMPTSPLENKIEAKDVQKIKESNGKLTINVKNIPKNAIVDLAGIEAGNKEEKDGIVIFDITEDVKATLTKSDKTEKAMKLLISVKAGAKEIEFPVTIKWDKLQSSTSNLSAIEKGKENRDKLIAQFKARTSFSSPYDNKNDKIDLYFNENGRMLNHLPVNVDQNDIFYMHIVCEKGEEEKYRVNVTEGDFAPTDLAIRPFTNIADGITGSSTGNKEGDLIPKEYSENILQAGPFTSNNFKFQIAYDILGTERNGPEYSFKINKLFHVGVGVSIVSSGLKAPDYKTYFNGTDTTIKAFNEGRRALFTFNVIWYWTIFHQNTKGSVIPNGRDVLKDEPTFTLTRLFPTVGVTLDSKFKENFFIGAVYEFARGGSFTAGMHYGKVSRLADKNFVLEKTAFSGTDTDIKLNSSYEPGFYIGINVDTRILNVLFGKGQQQPN